MYTNVSNEKKKKRIPERLYSGMYKKKKNTTTDRLENN